MIMVDREGVNDGAGWLIVDFNDIIDGWLTMDYSGYSCYDIASAYI